MSKESNLKIYEMLTALFVTISKEEQILDSIKQVLTTFDLFHPLVLFKYLTKGNPILQPKHVLAFLQENNYSAKQQDIKIIFSFQGVKQKMNYSTFLKMIYPYSMTANREITAVHLKNYYATENLPINEEILACFFLLITQHIQLINKIQVQKQDSLSTVSKQKINKVLRNIKKLSEKSVSHCQKSSNIINGIELIYFIKNFTTIQDSSLLYLLRRLGTNHLGLIEIQKLQAFVKPWKKKQSVKIQDKDQQSQDENQLTGKRFNEQMYRKQLNSQLQRSISNKKTQNLTKRKSRKQGSIKIKQGQFCDKKIQQKSGRKITSSLKTPVKQTLTTVNMRQKSKSQNEQKSAVKDHRSHQTKLFIKFISIFLKNSLQIQKLKEQLNFGNQINYLKIFKGLDRQQRGIIKAEDMENFYKQMGGINISINFNVLIEAFSQTAQNWLSYSQFCQIFKPSIERTQKSRSNSTYLQYQTSQSQRLLFSQIIYLTLMNEYELLQIRRQFSRQQLFNLFSLINKEQTGFINYQQLKHFLTENMTAQLSMYELMLVLKRLDKCKNGVVSQNQFVDYFLVKM